MIAISNMEMPKDCWECQMFGTWEGVGEFSCFLGAKVKDIDIRPTDCPLIDIVRCGECKWYDKDFKDCNIRDSYGWEYKPTDFCSHGERRTK